MVVEGVPTYLHVEKINAESKKIHKPILGQLTRTQQSWLHIFLDDQTQIEWDNKDH